MSSDRLQEVKNHWKIIKLSGPKGGRGRVHKEIVYFTTARLGLGKVWYFG